MRLVARLSGSSRRGTSRHRGGSETWRRTEPLWTPYSPEAGAHQGRRSYGDVTSRCALSPAPKPVGVPGVVGNGSAGPLEQSHVFHVQPM